MQQQVNQLISLVAGGIMGIKHLAGQKAQTEAIKKNTMTTQQLVDKAADMEIGEFQANAAEMMGYEEGSRLDIAMRTVGEATSGRYNAEQKRKAMVKMAQEMAKAPTHVTEGPVGTVKGTIPTEGGKK